jgi:Family of unknown function (DUF5335)
MIAQSARPQKHRSDQSRPAEPSLIDVISARPFIPVISGTAREAKEPVMTTRMISKPDWRPYFDQVSKTLVGRRAEIDVLSLKLGSQVQAQWVRLLGIAYDPKNDLLEVALEGLDHMIPKPLEIYVEEGPTGLESLSVLDSDGNRQIIRLNQPLVL